MIDVNDNDPIIEGGNTIYAQISENTPKDTAISFYNMSSLVVNDIDMVSFYLHYLRISI